MGDHPTSVGKGEKRGAKPGEARPETRSRPVSRGRTEVRFAGRDIVGIAKGTRTRCGNSGGGGPGLKSEARSRLASAERDGGIRAAEGRLGMRVGIAGASKVAE